MIDPSNYQPIAVVPVVAKILEKLSPHSLICILSKIICCTHIRVLIVVGNPLRTSYCWQLTILLRVSSRSIGLSYPSISIDGVELTVTKKQKYIFRA